jgi:hypothetical protein
MAAHGIGYVAFCPGVPERYDYAASTPNGLAALMSRNEVLSFLEKIFLEGTDLAVYRMRR